MNRSKKSKKTRTWIGSVLALAALAALVVAAAPVNARSVSATATTECSANRAQGRAGYFASAEGSIDDVLGTYTASGSAAAATQSNSATSEGNMVNPSASVSYMSAWVTVPAGTVFKAHAEASASAVNKPTITARADSTKTCGAPTRVMFVLAANAQASPSVEGLSIPNEIFVSSDAADGCSGTNVESVETEDGYICTASASD